jgi:hypothetical protein
MVRVCSSALRIQSELNCMIPRMAASRFVVVALCLLSSVSPYASGTYIRTSKPSSIHESSAALTERAISAPLLQGATQASIDHARELVEAAQAEAARLGKLRLKNPRRNTYGKARSVGVFRRAENETTTSHSPNGLLGITPELAAAAALLAEVDAAAEGHNQRRYSETKRAEPYWMESVTRKGTVPWGTDPTYKVFKSRLRSLVRLQCGGWRI